MKFKVGDIVSYRTFHKRGKIIEVTENEYRTDWGIYGGFCRDAKEFVESEFKLVSTANQWTGQKRT